MKWLTEKYAEDAGLNESAWKKKGSGKHAVYSKGKFSIFFDTKLKMWALKKFTPGNIWGPFILIKTAVTPEELMVPSAMKESLEELKKNKLSVGDSFVAKSRFSKATVPVPSGMKFRIKGTMANGDYEIAFLIGSGSAIAKRAALERAVKSGAVIKESINEAIKALSKQQLKQLDKAAASYGGRRKTMPVKGSISPTLQPSIKTWVFKDDGDAEEFETFAVEEMNLKANSFKHKGQYAVEVYSG